MADLNDLKRLTQELAEEIHYEEYGHIFKLMRLLFDSVESYVAIVDKNCKLLYLNPSAIKNFKERAGKDIKEGQNCLYLLQDNKSFCDICLVKEASIQRKVISGVITSPNTGITYYRTCIPLIYNGVSGVIEILEKKND